MANATEFELIRLQGAGMSLDRVCVERKDNKVLTTIGTGSSYYTWAVLPSEAVTIGEQLIAAGRTEEQA